jgi:hypothetical protein
MYEKVILNKYEEKYMYIKKSYFGKNEAAFVKIRN